MSEYMVSNKYITTAIQKAGIQCLSYRMEHVCIMGQLIKEAKVDKKDLTVVWLDLANAYGSGPPNLIEVAIDTYRVPRHIKNIVNWWTSDQIYSWRVFNNLRQLEKGKVAGCSISPIPVVVVR